MIFNYSALDRNGKTVSDIIDAVNIEKAKVLLKQDGLFVKQIAEASAGKNKNYDSIENKNINRFYNSISEYFANRSVRKEVALFSRQLATLIGAGMPLLKALNGIIEQTESKYFKMIISNVKDMVESGSTLSYALSKYGNIFSDMYINMVRVGENLGSIDEVVERLADIEEKNNVLKNKVTSAMIYPLMISGFFILFIIFLLTFVVPTITNVFVEMGQDLPIITKIVIFISTIFEKFWIVILVMLAAGAFYFRRYKHSEKGKIKLDEYKFKIPFIHKLYRKIVILRFTQNLGVLLDNSVDLLKSLEITKKIVNNRIVESEITSAIEKIKEGSSVTKAFEKYDFLPKMVLGMMAVGESGDRLDEMLLKISDIYETEIDNQINSLTKIIEPLIIIVLGVIIGFIVVSIALPLFEMNTLI